VKLITTGPAAPHPFRLFLSDHAARYRIPWRNHAFLPFWPIVASRGPRRRTSRARNSGSRLKVEGRTVIVAARNDRTTGSQAQAWPSLAPYPPGDFRVGAIVDVRGVAIPAENSACSLGPSYHTILNHPGGSAWCHRNERPPGVRISTRIITCCIQEGG